MRSLDLFVFSKFRSELMGIAALFILICHLPVYADLPPYAAKILGTLGLGCDIFLFLSGLGMNYSVEVSISSKKSVFNWYLKRYYRIIIPYLLLVVPIFIYNHKELDILHFLITCTGLDFFFYELALWFVSCILVLYLLTPFLHSLLTGKYRYIWCVFFILLSLVLAYPWISSDFQILNIQFVVGRFPCYFIGYVIATEIKRGKKINPWWIILFSLCVYGILYSCNKLYESNFNLFWLQGVFMISIIAIGLNSFYNERIFKFYRFMGRISLESYITNVLLLPILFLHLKGYYSNALLLYIVCTILCIGISTLVHKLSQILLNKVKFLS